MSEQEPPAIPRIHSDPCRSLSDFKKLVIGILGLQGLFVMASLTLTVNTQRSLAAASEKLMKVETRQEMIEQKADNASADASRALAISGKAESNIAWIREGLTELKIAVRTERFQPQVK